MDHERRKKKKRRVISQPSLKLKVAPWNSAQRRKKKKTRERLEKILQDTYLISGS